MKVKLFLVLLAHDILENLLYCFTLLQYFHQLLLRIPLIFIIFIKMTLSILTCINHINVQF